MSDLLDLDPAPAAPAAPAPAARPDFAALARAAAAERAASEAARRDRVGPTAEQAAARAALDAEAATERAADRAVDALDHAPTVDRVRAILAEHAGLPAGPHRDRVGAAARRRRDDLAALAAGLGAALAPAAPAPAPAPAPEAPAGADLLGALGGIAAESARAAALPSGARGSIRQVAADGTAVVAGRPASAAAAATAPVEDAAERVRRAADAQTARLLATQIATEQESASSWWEIGWRGHGSISRADLRTAAGEAPADRAARTHLSRAVDAARGRGVDAARVGGALPPGVVVRWQLGVAGVDGAAVGGRYGRCEARVDLTEGGDLAVEGDRAILGPVVEDYARRTGGEILTPADVSAWLDGVLHGRYEAIPSGSDWLVPPRHREAARALVARVARVWGRAWRRGGLGADGRPVLGRSITDVAQVFGQIVDGLESEVEGAEARWATTVKGAASHGRAPGIDACATARERVQALARRLDAHGFVGAGVLDAAAGRTAALLRVVEAAEREALRADAGAARASLIELA